MKAVPLALLILAGLLFLWARRMEPVSVSVSWWGLLRAMAEAGIVGGLADWFAVTALFRRPLGLPIPHTALIPSKKDQLGESLSTFVHTNFISAENVRDKVLRTQPAGRIGEYLADPGHRGRLVSESCDLIRRAVLSLDDRDIELLIRNAVFTELGANAWGPPMGRLLRATVADGKHNGLVDALLTAFHRWLLENRDDVARVIADRGPVSQGGPIRWLHEQVGFKGVDLLTEWVAQLRDDPRDPARLQLDAALLRLAEDFRTDPATIERVESWKWDVLQHPETRRAVDGIWPAARGLLLDGLENPASDLRQRLDTFVENTASRLRRDREFAESVDFRIGQAAAYLVDRYGQEAAAVISETVRRWDGREASRRIELAVGRDLQYIRINGTVVGSLAGMAIYTVSSFL